MSGGGRCACASGQTLQLGACVTAAVGDAFCGPAARAGVDGCTFRGCGGDEAVDVATGACVPRTAVARAGSFACAPGTVAIPESGQLSCLPADATCPRGTELAAGRCVRRPLCPAGSLAFVGQTSAGSVACVPVVSAGGRTTGERVDVGAWAAIALGVDGAEGSHDLCRPIAQRPLAFGVAPHASLVVHVRVQISIPDEDVSRVRAAATARGEGGTRLPASGEAVVSDAVGSAVEMLRGLGGEASTGVVAAEVRCVVGQRASAPAHPSPMRDPSIRDP